MESIEITGYSFPRVKYTKWHEIKIPIYIHQAATIDTYERKKNILLCTKTGSGKTAAALFPIIKNGHSAIFIYPTNALIKNQVINIYKTLTALLNKKVYIRNNSIMKILLDPEPCSNPGKADICLHIVNREVLEAEGYSQRGEVIESILHDPVKQTIVLTNPDTLFAMLSLSYREHLNIVRALEKYKVIVIDEFHMYYGVQLANIIFMLKFAEKLIPNAFQRKIFLSATSKEELEQLLKNLFKVETPKITEKYEEVGSYPALQPVILYPFLLVNELPTSTIYSIIKEIRRDIKRLREIHIKNRNYVPCVIIVNSVVDAIHLEEEIANSYPDLKVSPYHGLMSKFERKIEDTHIIIGTSAIEVGIDFQCSFLIFNAGDSSSFLQRFGRIGRHKIEGDTPTAYVFLPKHVYESLKELKPGKISRDDFEKFINTHYANYSSYHEFVSSDYGMVQAYIFIKKLQRLLAKNGEIPERAKLLIDSYIEELYSIFKKDRKKIERILKFAKSWFSAYLNSVSFRSTLPTVLVYDRREERRNRIPIYETEVSTALEKGMPCYILPKPEETFYTIMKKYRPDIKIKLDKNLPMVLIDNYNYRYTLTFTTIKKHPLYVPFVCEKSDIFMQRKNENFGLEQLFEGHIAMFIRPNDYILTDWRIKKFKTEEGNKYLVFDGDVLLYLYLLDRKNDLEDIRCKNKTLDFPSRII
ncbi:MAG: type I-D CRISPR-associated helicase Cas3' [Spirochaetes bacterium]|nr:MAG: type I-D CRISPR-associated helicase Cas3' [Spirochaetota bacterium]